MNSRTIPIVSSRKRVLCEISRSCYEAIDTPKGREHADRVARWPEGPPTHPLGGCKVECCNCNIDEKFSSDNEITFTQCDNCNEYYCNDCAEKCITREIFVYCDNCMIFILS